MPAPFNSCEAIAITGIGPMCPGVTTTGELAAAIRSGNLSDGFSNDDWFDAARYLGPRKFKYLTPATRYALAAAGEALADAGIGEAIYEPGRRGAFVGTNFAVCAVHDAMDQVVLNEGAMSLSPMEAANFSVNLAASHISVRYGFRAFNACLTSSIVAGMEAIVFAAQSIRSARCAVALAGATEDRPPAAAAILTGGPLTHGAACMLVLESLQDARRRGARCYALLGRASLRFAPPASVETAEGLRHLECIVREQVDRVVAPDQRSFSYCPLRLPGRFNRAVDEIITAEFVRRGLEVRRLRYAGSDGAFMAVSPVLQVASAAVDEKECLVAVSSHEGHIGLLSLHAAREPGSKNNASGGIDDERKANE